MMRFNDAPTPSVRLARLDEDLANPDLDEQQLNNISSKLRTLKAEVEATPDSLAKLLLPGRIAAVANKVAEFNQTHIPMSVEP